MDQGLGNSLNVARTLYPTVLCRLARQRPRVSVSATTEKSIFSHVNRPARTRAQRNAGSCAVEQVPYGTKNTIQDLGTRVGKKPGRKTEGSNVNPVAVDVTRNLLKETDRQTRLSLLDRANPDSAMCRQILTYIDIQGAPDLAVEILQWKTQKNDWNVNDATVLWTKCMKMQMKRPCGASRALEVYDLMKDSRIPFDVVSFNTAISAASTCGKWKKVTAIRQDMTAAGIRADAFTYSSLLGGCKANGTWRQAKRWFEEMETSGYIKPNVFHYTTLMTTLQRAGAWEESLKVFRKMEAAGVTADVVSYNAAITACAKGEDWQQAWAIFISMRREGVEPSVISYNALLSACERCGQTDRALEVFDNMKRRGIVCNQVTYNTLISACGKSGKYGKALEINQQMKLSGVREDVFTLTGLLSACGKAGDWKRALSLIQEFRKMGVRPNVVVYNQLISILGDNLEWRRAVAAWQTMQDDNIEPDIVTFGAMLSTLEKAGKWREALDFYDDLIEGSPNLEPNIYIYSSVLNACERGRQWDRATQLFKVMMERGWDSELHMNSIAILARKAMYASPAVLSAMPDPLVTAAKSVVESGRAARNWLSKPK